ncbi:MAG: di-heme oxidoredictase family protein [Sandaracinaceae bacterium]
MSFVRPAALAAAVATVTACSTPQPQTVPDDVFAELGAIVPYATSEQRAAFERGQAVALRRFTLEDGLGFEFNISFCGGCHERPVFGGSAGRYRDFLLIAEQINESTQAPAGVAGVLPVYHRTEGRNPTDPAANLSARRNPIPFFGVGLLAEISDDAIRANADPDDRDGDGISGRVNEDGSRVGRFGRKAQTVSIEGFIRGPLFNHLGITTDPLTTDQQNALPVPSGTDRAFRQHQRRLRMGAIRSAQVQSGESPTRDDDGVPDPELSPQDLFDVISWSMLLAAPEPDEPTPETEEGRVLFGDLGCEGCHVPTLQSPRGRLPLYSDLLLHDMGPELADGITTMGLAEGSEFRTQPLWGVVATGPYLHDGRADTLDEAIRMHGGEARAARDAYAALDAVERQRVLTFLASLGGREQVTDGLLPPAEPVPAPGQLGGPDRELSTAELLQYEAGRAFFDRDVFVTEGLGPEFNGDSCRACHFEPMIGGAGPIGVNVIRQGIVDGDDVLAPAAGTLLHRFSAEAVRPESDPAADVFELRQTPPMFGLGLLGAVPEAVILEAADPDDDDGDAVSGRAHRLGDGRLGRFGWKAQVPSLAEFARDALTAEVGLTLPAQEGLTFGATVDDDAYADPEVALADLEDLVFFIERLGPPPRQRTDPEAEDRGEALFAEVGCADCHRVLRLDDGTPVAAYTDLLLHDVTPGEEPAVGTPDGMASPRELRTPPLWGLVDTGPYMHDGRAGTIEAAIDRHFGEADRSQAAYSELSAADRADLLAFLRSL